MEALANWIGQYFSNQDGLMFLIFGIIAVGIYIIKKIEKGDFHG